VAGRVPARHTVGVEPQNEPDPLAAAGWGRDPADRPTADLVSGRHFTVVGESGRGRYVIRDADSRPVMFLPLALGGEVLTRAEGWLVAVERRRRGWAVIARASPGGAEAGGASVRWQPNAYRVWLEPATSCRLSRTNPFRSRWTLRAQGAPIARLELAGGYAGATAVRGEREVGAVETLAESLASINLGLAIALSLEMVKAERSIPRADGPSAS
jgi:hypothetical protein